MWLQTYTGLKVYPKNFQPEQIDIRDIARSLSMQVRFGGHMEKFYSVAQHSVLCSRYIQEEYALCALLHDATEAYIGDMPKPIKECLPDFQRMEKSLWEKAIAPSFGLDTQMPTEVHAIDYLMLGAEARDLISQTEGWRIPSADEVDFIEKIVPLNPEEAEKEFLSRFKELYVS